MAEEKTTPTEPNASDLPGTPEESVSPLRIALALLTFLIGIVVGIAAVLLLILAMSGSNPPITTSPPQPSNISVQADATLIGPIAEKSLQEADIPGKITNLQVQFALGDQMTITGAYQYNVLSVPVTQNFTIMLQPYVDSCNLQVHIIQANYGSIPVTGFASIFEKQINDKIQQVIPSTVLKGSYALCTTGVHTQTGSIIVAFSVTPLPS